MILPPGTTIKTTQDAGNGGWHPLLARVWGEPGIIVGHHDSHGLCYCVAHFRSGMQSQTQNRKTEIAFYEREEFHVVTLPVPLSKSHFPISEALVCGSDENVSAFQKRTMLHQFVTRYNCCNAEWMVRDRLDNQSLYAGEPMASYCHHCGMMCDILPEDFLCLPRTACTPCQQLLDLNLMEEAQSHVRSHNSAGDGQSQPR